MSKEEIRYEINKVLERLPDKALDEILSFLKHVEQKQSSSMFDKSTIDKVLIEDAGLLSKLAQ